MVTKSATFSVSEVAGKPILSFPDAVAEGRDWNKIPFSYREFATYEEATSSADWSPKAVLDLINSSEKANAKAKEYQAVTKPYRPDPNDPAVAEENQVQVFIKKFKVPEQIARQQVRAMIESAAQQTT